MKLLRTLIIYGTFMTAMSHMKGILSINIWIGSIVLICTVAGIAEMTATYVEKHYNSFKIATRYIKFRAKRLDNNDLVVGWLIQESYNHTERALIITYFQQGEYIEGEDIIDCQAIIREVDPNTLSIYTGYQDKKGNDIYKKYN